MNDSVSFQFDERKSIRSRLLNSHVQIACIGLGAILLGLFAAIWLRHHANQLANERLPLLQTINQANQGLAAGTSALRSWVALGDHQFIKERNDAWNEKVFPAIAFLDQHYSTSSGDHQSVSRLKTAIDDLYTIQWRIEDAAQTPGNEPARTRYDRDIHPIAELLMHGITEMIDFEKRELNNSSNEISAGSGLAGQMADFRFYFTTANLTLANFAATGDGDLNSRFDYPVLRVRQARNELNIKRSRLTSNQREILNWLIPYSEAFERMGREVIEQRNSPQWNIARHWLKTEAVPCARQAQSTLKQLTENQSLMVNQASQFVAWLTGLIMAMTGALVVLTGCAAYGMSRSFADQLVRPIQSLCEATEGLREGDWSKEIKIESNDELGKLAETFVHTRRSLQELTNEVSEQNSQIAWMAEFATAILHNVGNVLNSLNVSGNYVLETLNSSQVETLCRASSVISEQNDIATFLTEDKRGKVFPELLDQLATELEQERETELKEIRSMLDNIEHVKEIIATQQSSARVTVKKTDIDVRQLMEKAIQINLNGLQTNSIELVREFGDIQNIVNHEHKLIQILVNLVSNAKNALIESDQQHRLLKLSIQQDDDQIVVQVIDNGVGILDKNMSKLFTHGFTTREDGHGFGLHSCVIAAKQIGGTLTASSDGKDCGATFTLTVPVTENSTCKV